MMMQPSLFSSPSVYTAYAAPQPQAGWGYTSAPAYTPMPQAPQMPSIQQSLALLGTQTQFDPYRSHVLMNLPLIDSLAGYKEGVVPALNQLLATSNNTPQILEGLYLAQRLSENGTQNVKELYPTTTRFHDTQDPYIKVYLAGFYRKLNDPSSFGPMMSMLFQPPMTPHPFDTREEVGGTVLQQIAQTTANETVKQLLPYLQRPTLPPAPAAYPTTPWGTMA